MLFFKKKTDITLFLYICVCFENYLVNEVFYDPKMFGESFNA